MRLRAGMVTVTGAEVRRISEQFAIVVGKQPGTCTVTAASAGRFASHSGCVALTVISLVSVNALTTFRKADSQLGASILWRAWEADSLTWRQLNTPFFHGFSSASAGVTALPGSAVPAYWAVAET